MRYVKPEIKVIDIKTEDIILTSTLLPSATVGGEDAVNLGSKTIDIFDE